MNRETRTERSRDLRQRQTYAENKLWQAIRGGRLDGLKIRQPCFFCQKLLSQRAVFQILPANEVCYFEKNIVGERGNLISWHPVAAANDKIGERKTIGRFDSPGYVGRVERQILESKFRRVIVSKSSQFFPRFAAGE